MRASQAGFIFLQCPHQGARNLTKIVFPSTASSHVSGVSSVAAAEARARARIVLNLGEAGA
jgi:hypothetical protein